MRYFRALISVVLLLTGQSLVFAQDKVLTLSAMCKEPEGYLITYQDKEGKPQSMKDGFKGAAWSFQWSTSNPSAGKVVTQNSQSAGGDTHGADAAVFYSDKLEAITFVVGYETGTWFYTLYPSSKVMVASRHMISAMHKGGSGAVFSAKCDMGIQ